MQELPINWCSNTSKHSYLYIIFFSKLKLKISQRVVTWDSLITIIKKIFFFYDKDMISHVVRNKHILVFKHDTLCLSKDEQ